MINSPQASLEWLETLPEWDALARERIELLIDMLRSENEQQNLVSAVSLAEIWQRHIVDSAQLLRFVPRETRSTWLDLGTGAGFPGLVIAALCPNMSVTMVESRARRIAWLEKARSALGLAAATIAGSRLELLPTRQFRVISARAFAPLPKLLELSARFSTKDTVYLLPKGRSAQHELSELTRWNHKFHVEQSVTDVSAGVIVGRLLGPKGRNS